MARSKPPPGSGEFTAEQYKSAADEHAGRLTRLYDLRYYVAALYLAGVAVECILRAYRARINPEFDARHDLHELVKAARFMDIVPRSEIERIGAAVTVLATRWSNNHRYRSEKGVRDFLKRAGLHRGIRGDFLKENTRQAILAAMSIVTLGVARWTSS